MSEAKRAPGFLFSGTASPPTHAPGEQPSARVLHDFSRRVRNEKLASVFHKFLVAHVHFEAIAQMFEGPDDKPRFENIDLFVQQNLFSLKEECHALFRRTSRAERELLFTEDVFDLLIGSIFHEMMKIKENCYILEHYGPTFREMKKIADRRIRLPEYERLFFKSCKRIVERANKGAYDDIRAAAQLFEDAKQHLLHMLPQLAHNGLITRMLVENQQLVEMAYGEGGLEQALTAMYEGRLANAYLHVASSYLEAGRFEQAAEHCRKGLEKEPQNRAAQRLMERIEARL